MIERLQCPDAPVTEDEAPEEEYPCPYAPCTMVFRGPDAWYELGAHEVEHLED
jgi:hypothetical protein